MDIIFSTVKILGSSVHMVKLPDVVSAMESWIQKPEIVPRRIVVTGFHGIWEAYNNLSFKAVLNTADLWVPDGIAPVWIARRRGFPDAQRNPGADLMRAFFQCANEKRFSSFFYGDTNDTLDALRENLERDYPGHKIAGTFSPPFREITIEEDDAHIKMINDARPDVLWVGLGLPKQDIWIYERMGRLKVPVAVGVGAAFKFISGKVKRCPDWIGDHGMEWAWRFIREPKKLWRRDLLDGPRFLFHVVLELTGLRNYD